MNFLITFGADVKERNSLADTRTLKRLDRSYERWRERINDPKLRFDYWVVTGGSCHPPHIQTIPTADLMAEWLLKMPKHERPREDQIIRLDQARDTWEEVHHFMHNRSTEYLRITAVSERRHVRRIGVIFWKVYNQPVNHLPVDYPLSRKEILMEDFLYLYTHYDPYGTGWIARKNRAQRTYSPA